MSYLLDSNIVSELRKRERADAGVRQWFAGVTMPSCFLSVLTWENSAAASSRFIAATGRGHSR